MVTRFPARRVPTTLTILFVALVLMLLGGEAAAPAAAAPAGLKVSTNSIPAPHFALPHEALDWVWTHGEKSFVPEGVNNPDCRVTPTHPEAVILVHGTDSTTYLSFASLGAALARDGWCVFGADYGLGPHYGDGFGWAPLQQSVVTVDELIQAAKASSGAAHVSVVGFSQGAVLSRYWVNKIDKGKTTKTWIGLASPTRGGTFYGVEYLGRFLPEEMATLIVAPSLLQLLSGSRFMQWLNADGETVPGPAYVTISTAFDEMNTDQAGQPIFGPKTRNLSVQSMCPTNHGGHIYMPYNPTVIDTVKYLLHDWTDGGKWGQFRCPAVDFFAAVVPNAVVANLRKLDVKRPQPTPVSYVTVNLG